MRYIHADLPGLTNAFSKKIENHTHAVALHMMYYNFVRIHQTMRMTPAMAAGITKRLLGMADVVDYALRLSKRAKIMAIQTDPLPAIRWFAHMPVTGAGGVNFYIEAHPHDLGAERGFREGRPADIAKTDEEHGRFRGTSCDPP